MSKEAQVEQLTDYMAKFIAHVAKKLPDDVIAKLTELRAQEDSPLSKTIYDTMFQNQELAVKLNRPSCQDTGVLQFWVKCGTNFPLIGELEALLKEAVVKQRLRLRSATTVLRHSMSTTQAKMSEKEHRRSSGILFRTVISVRFTPTWQAADVRFRARRWS